MRLVGDFSGSRRLPRRLPKARIFRHYFPRAASLRPVLDTVAAACRQANERTAGRAAIRAVGRSAGGARNLTMGAILWASRIAAAVAASVIMTAGAHAQGTVKSVHGDWQVRCDTPPGAQGEQCALIQSVTAEDRPNV